MNIFNLWTDGLGRLGASLVNSVDDVMSFFQSREVLRELPKTKQGFNRKKLKKMVRSLKRRGMLETVFLL
ncbi:MAG: hypothetical protein GOU99_00955 [Candidatus Altiarchaeota archaeon]|nr:hypothetical protein [Candidatus Altiarchaeota archaeon]